MGEVWLDFDFTRADLFFRGLFSLTPPTFNGVEGGFLSFFFFFTSKAPVAIGWYNRWVVFTRDGLTFLLGSRWDFDVVRLQVFFTALEKNNSGIGFSLRSFRKDCGIDEFCFSFLILGSYLRMLGGLHRSGSIWLWCSCIYICYVHRCCSSYTSLLFHGTFSLCTHIRDLSCSSLVLYNSCKL